jgi:hypothetical protein
VRTDPSAVVDISGEGWYERCSYVALNAPEFVEISTRARYRFAYWDIDGASSGMDEKEVLVHMNCCHTATAHFVVQFYLMMFTNYGTIVPGDGWYDAGSEVAINAIAPSTVSGERYLWDGWSGLGDGNYTGGNKEATVVMNSPLNETASWHHQYYLTVVSHFGNTEGEGWYYSADTAYATLDTDTVDHWNGTRRLFSVWSGDASGTGYYESDPIVMDKPKTAIASWKTQYALNATSSAGGTTAPHGFGWYDETTVVSVLAIPDVDYLLDYWKLDNVTVGSANPLNITMDTAHTVHGMFVSSQAPNYFLSVKVVPDGMAKIPGQGWYDENETVALTASERVIIDTHTRYDFQYWDVDGSSRGIGITEITIVMDANHTATAFYKQYEPVVGGSTVSITSHLFKTWSSVNAVFVASVLVMAFWKKKRWGSPN